MKRQNTFDKISKVTKSKPDFLGVLLVLIGTVASIGIFIWSMLDWMTGNPAISTLLRAVFMIISGPASIAFIWLEFPKLKSIEVNDQTIIVTNLITRATKQISIEETDGFTTTSKMAKGGPVYEITIICRGRIFQKISSNYIKNYDQIRAELGKRLKPLK